MEQSSFILLQNKNFISYFGGHIGNFFGAKKRSIFTQKISHCQNKEDIDLITHPLKIT